jgi:hypothetical protein
LKRPGTYKTLVLANAFLRQRPVGLGVGHRQRGFQLTRSAFALARSSARSARAFVTFKGMAARMGVVARSVPAGAAAEAFLGMLSTPA